MVNNEITCKEVVELVTDYLEQTLLPEVQTSFEAHVADCPGCDTYIAQVQQTIAMLRKMTEEQMFPGTREELLEMFREWKKG
ncbi:MAG TPA: zf-HC2 domain-containing protein [Ktedonobacteraceae bacterium]